MKNTLSTATRLQRMKFKGKKTCTTNVLEAFGQRELIQTEIKGNSGESGWTGTNSFVLKVPLCNLRLSIIYSVICDWIVQRAYRECAS